MERRQDLKHHGTLLDIPADPPGLSPVLRSHSHFPPRRNGPTKLYHSRRLTNIRQLILAGLICFPSAHNYPERTPVCRPDAVIKGQSWRIPGISPILRQDNHYVCPTECPNGVKYHQHQEITILRFSTLKRVNICNRDIDFISLDVLFIKSVMGTFYHEI